MAKQRWPFAEKGRTEPCDFDSCEMPGECDGRHCSKAAGAIRPTLDEINDARDYRAGLEPGADPRAFDALNELFLCSIAISMKRIADAVNSPNDHGEVGGAAIAGSIMRGLRNG